MMAPDSNHEVPMDGFDVQGASDCIVQPNLSTAPDQSLQLVPHQHMSSSKPEIGLLSSANVDSGIDGRLRSSGSPNVVRISPGMDCGARRGSSLNPKPLKRKNAGCNHHQSEVKKQRLIWTEELHQFFLEIHNQSPNEKPVPKKILEQMKKKFPYITRENVASHLQKHRLNLKKLKNKDQLGNSSKSSSKSVPLKLKKESNFQQTDNNINPISTCPNDQFPLQSHSISTSPPLQNQSQSQSHSISTGPIAQLPPPSQSHPISTSPNSLLPLHETFLNQVLSQFDQPYLSDSVRVQSSVDMRRNSNVPIHGGMNIRPNMVSVLESQRNPYCGAVNGASDFRINFRPPISTNQFPNIDGNGHGFHPIMGNSYGGLTNNEYFVGNYNLQNFGFGDYNMNLNFNHYQQVDANNMIRLGSYYDDVQFGYPLNFNLTNVTNELQPKDFEQALQSVFYQPCNHLFDEASILPQSSGNFAVMNESSPFESNNSGQYLKFSSETSYGGQFLKMDGI